MNQIACDFAFVCVLRQELEAILGRVDAHRVTAAPLGSGLEAVYSARISCTRSSTPGRAIQGVVVPIFGVGRVEAAITATVMLRFWRPRYLILVGCAGGFAQNGVSVGDVIVASDVIDYSMNKVTPEGTSFREQRYPANHALLRAAMKMTEYEPQASRVHFGPVLSGDRVIASSSVVREILRGEPRLLGVEMEAGGVLAAIARQHVPPEFLMIRGVSDLADESKDDEWILRASDAAAHYAVELLRTRSAELFPE